MKIYLYKGIGYFTRTEVEEAIREHVSSNFNNIDVPDEWIQQEYEEEVEEVEE